MKMTLKTTSNMKANLFTPNLPNKKYQRETTKLNLPNQTRPTRPNLPNQTYQTKSTKSSLPNQTYQTEPIKARQVKACPELGTAQPQLVIVIIVIPSKSQLLVL